MNGICLAEVKSVSGKGRLTDVMINRIKSYFGEPIRKNKGNIPGIQNDTWAIFKPMIQDILSQQQNSMQIFPNVADASTGQIIQTMILQKGCHEYLLMF